MSDELTPREQTAFWKRRFGTDGTRPVRERRNDGGFLIGIDGHPIGYKRELRSAHRALPPSRKAELLEQRMAQLYARVDALEQGATSLDDLP